jgi:pSer/pThr/pTyr-binding forkhead associated (FHA) protein
MTRPHEDATLIPIEAPGAPPTPPIRLDRPETVLGRTPGCDVVIPRGHISRQHARIAREGPRYVLYDLDSANGTFVNGRPLARPHPLKHRDTIGLGDPEPLLRFLDPDPTVERRSRLRYDAERLAFALNGQELQLTPNETRLLLHLYQNRGAICAPEQCAAAIWGEAYEPGRDARLDGVLRDIRTKLRAIDGEADCIQTHRGRGYELIC